MPHVQVTIAGRGYRMACGEGEEPHLETLAATYDAKIAEMRTAFGEIGDMRLHVMAALTLADEAAEHRKRFADLAEELAGIQAAAHASGADAHAAEDRIAAAVTALSERVERIAAALVTPAAAHDPD